MSAPSALQNEIWDVFDDFARYYDAFTAHHDYELWMDRLEALAVAHGLVGPQTARRRLRHRQEPRADARARLRGDRLRRLRRACSPRRRPKLGARARLVEADMRALPELGSLRPRHLHRRAAELPARRRRPRGRLRRRGALPRAGRDLPLRPQHAAHVPHGVRARLLPRARRLAVRLARPVVPAARAGRSRRVRDRGVRAARRRLLATPHQPARAAPPPAGAGGRAARRRRA